MTHCLENFLKEQDVKFYKSYSMQKLSSIRIGGMADIVAFPDTRAKLVKIVDFVVENRIKYKIAGRMTNILPCDDNYRGVLILTKCIREYSLEDNTVRADCGVIFSNLICNLAEQNLGGVYDLYGIPGSVGGMISCNAGAYNLCMADCFIEADVYSPKTKEIFKFSHRDMKFSYRESIVKNTDLIILSALIKLDYVCGFEERKKIKDVLLKRKISQPYDKMSLGSVFKRKNGIPISKLIDNIGMKGFSVGDAEISNKHAGFIINNGHATARDILQLVDIIKENVNNRYGILPELEIEILNGD